MTDQNQILERAKEMANEWIAAFKQDGDGDPWAVFHELSKRVHKGLPVRALVARDLDETVLATTALARLSTMESDIEDHEWDDILRNTQARILGADWAEARPIDVDIFSPLPNPEREDTAQERARQAYRCVWDYYYMAFYACAYAQCPDQSHEFGRQSFFEPFRSGIGFYVNCGGYAIGVMMPEVHLDEERRIHHPTQAAIVWGNRKEYWFRGVKVPEEWILQPDSVDPTLALTRPNIEERRALSLILGWERVLGEQGITYKTIDKSPDPEIGELIEVTDQRFYDAEEDVGERARFLRVVCGTGRRFTLRVSPDMQTALEANARSYRLKPEDYNPEVRT